MSGTAAAVAPSSSVRSALICPRNSTTSASRRSQRLLSGVIWSFPAPMRAIRRPRCAQPQRLLGGRWHNWLGAGCQRRAQLALVALSALNLGRGRLGELVERGSGHKPSVGITGRAGIGSLHSTGIGTLTRWTSTWVLVAHPPRTTHVAIRTTTAFMVSPSP